MGEAWTARSCFAPKLSGSAHRPQTNGRVKEIFSTVNLGLWTPPRRPSASRREIRYYRLAALDFASGAARATSNPLQGHQLGVAPLPRGRSSNALSSPSAASSVAQTRPARRCARLNVSGAAHFKPPGAITMLTTLVGSAASLASAASDVFSAGLAAPHCLACERQLHNCS
jgi:hypothetical protein